MEGSDDVSLSAQIECAGVFDRKLAEMRKKVCEPSRLGGGTLARMAIETVKSEAESLMEYVSKFSEDVKSNNAAAENRLSEIQKWMEEVSSQLEPLEAKGREAGLIQTNGLESEKIDTPRSLISENSQESKFLSFDSYENGHRQGRKSLSRRLFTSPSPFSKK